MKHFLRNIQIIITIVGCLSLSGCTDTLFDGNATKDGAVSVTLNFGFEPLTEGLKTRAVKGDLDFGIRNLIVLFYEEGAAETAGPRYAFSFDADAVDTGLADRAGSATEKKTRQGKVTLENIITGNYRIYAVANVDDLLNETYKTITEKALRDKNIEWPKNEETSTDPKTTPTDYNIPDAMFGYFSTDDNKQNVIYHKNSLWKENSSDEGYNNRAEVIKIDRSTKPLHAWLKRTVSKLTIAFDGSGLSDGVSITIKSVHLRDIAKSCLLGADNTPTNRHDLLDISFSGDTPEKGKTDGETSDSFSSDDLRCTIDWSDNSVAITKDAPHFPAVDVEPENWKSAVHAQERDALYFFENMQGITDGKNGTNKKQSTDGKTLDDNENGYRKDHMPYGTYIEVHAQYKNPNSSGNIIYRFMLGKDIETDFNAERNYHYKLTMKFVGNANDVDWHIDYEEDIYFPIPSDEPGAQYSWNDSWVWHAYNDEGEPIAEICKEMVFYFSDGDPNETPDKRAKRKYYQVVTVYPVKNNSARDNNDKYKYTVDLNNGRIAQVLACATKELDDNDLRAGGEISMLLRTQADPAKHEESSERAASKYGDRAIRNITTGNHTNYDFVQVLSSTYDQKIPGPILMNVNNTNYDNGSYIKFSMSDDKTDKNKLEYKLDLVEEKQGKELRIKPYRIQDADGNSYSVTKIGGSYWARENLRSRHYFAVDGNGKPSGMGQEIFPYKLPKYEQIYTDEKGNEIRTNFDSENGYDYDYGIENEGSGWVYFHERYPMYKECDGGNFLMYNFFAAIGVQGKVVDGSLSYKKGNGIKPAHRILNNTDQNLAIVTQIGSINQKKYENPDNEIEDIDTTEPYDLEPFDPTNYNLPLAPEGWHTLPLDDSQSHGPGPFGEMKNEYQYFYYYFADYLLDADNWEYALSEIGYTTGYMGWKWPKSYTKITKKILQDYLYYQFQQTGRITKILLLLMLVMV